MKFEIHLIAAKEHLEVGKSYDKKYAQEKDEDAKISFRTVAAQNFFYSAINAIECVFAKEKGEHSFNHENRYRKFMEHKSLFTEEVLTLFPIVDRNERNRVAYRGENGKRYENMKKLALKIVGDISG